MLKRFLCIGLIFIIIVTAGCRSVVENKEYMDGLYEGDWLFGEPSGHGTGVFKLDDGTVTTYEGNWRSGEKHGDGKQVTEQPDGTVLTYEGRWINGKKYGQGAQSYLRADGTSILYDGEFHNDLMHGEGFMTVTMTISGEEGEEFLIVEHSGKFENGQKHGYGKETTTDIDGNIIGSRSGTWLKDKFVG